MEEKSIKLLCRQYRLSKNNEEKDDIILQIYNALQPDLEVLIPDIKEKLSESNVNYLDNEDIRQECIIAIIYVLQTNTVVTKNQSNNKIKDMILRAIKRNINKYINNDADLYNVISSDTIYAKNYYEEYDDINRMLDSVILLSALQEMKCVINKRSGIRKYRSYESIILRYCYDYKLKDLSDYYGISSTSVNQYIARGLYTLKEICKRIRYRVIFSTYSERHVEVVKKPNSKKDPEKIITDEEYIRKRYFISDDFDIRKLPLHISNIWKPENVTHEEHAINMYRKIGIDSVYDERLNARFFIIPKIYYVGYYTTPRYPRSIIVLRHDNSSAIIVPRYQKRIEMCHSHKSIFVSSAIHDNWDNDIIKVTKENIFVAYENDPELDTKFEIIKHLEVERLNEYLNKKYPSWRIPTAYWTSDD